MSMGFQTFIKGTTLDAVNSMAFNFVIDYRTISGSGSATYNYPGFTVAVAVVNSFNTRGDQSFNVSVSGQTVSWNVTATCKIVVTLTPTASADPTSPYFGFSFYDYSSGSRRFKIAPDFTPFNLTQVFDLTPSASQIIQTNVPASQPMLAFHRCTAGGYDNIWWDEIQQNGYWAIRFRPTFGLAMKACRIYVFAKLMVNVPNWGFFMYQRGGGPMVWHSNCLPLQINILTGGNTVTKSTPMAVTSCVTAAITVRTDPGTPNVFNTYYNNADAGTDNGNWNVIVSNVYASQIAYTAPSIPGSWSAGPPAWIDTPFYDTYYRQALGV